MCRPNERAHKHHIIPRYMGGSNEPKNLVKVTVTQHAMFHFCNYQLWGNEEDRIAWRALSGQITMDEIKLEAQSLNGKRNSQKQKENGTGIFGLTLEQRIEAGKKGGQIHKENGTGICGLTYEQRREIGKRTNQKCKKNGTAFYGMSPEKRSENGKKGAEVNRQNGTGIFGLTPEQKIERSRKSGQKTYEDGIGIHGMDPEERVEVCKKGGKKGGKIVSSQKWQCTVTGYVSNAGGLSRFQKAKGIDTSNRIKIDGPRSWEITFEDGRVVVTNCLSTWAKENGYKYVNIHSVRIGNSSNYQGIVKVVPF
jgi:hypothetical protein